MKEDFSTASENYSEPSFLLKLSETSSSPVKITPRWEGTSYSDTEFGQQLFIPRSSPTRLVARARIMKGYLSTHKIVAEGEYTLDHYPESQVLKEVDSSVIERLCWGASVYCEESMEKVIFK
jgi:hypothetical protein